jgi:hypothetical protein
VQVMKHDQNYNSQSLTVLCTYSARWLINQPIGYQPLNFLVKAECCSTSHFDIIHPSRLSKQLWQLDAVPLPILILSTRLFSVSSCDSWMLFHFPF